MDDRTTCGHCSFHDDPETTCHAVASGHVRLCELSDPSSPSYRPAMVEAVRRLTLEPLGRYEPPAAPPRHVPAPSFPPPAKQARNFVGSMARFVASGLATTTAEERERRLAICHACEFFAAGRCLKCGCFTKWAARVASKHCPLDPPKW
jgi:hypothetical protein